MGVNPVCLGCSSRMLLLGSLEGALIFRCPLCLTALALPGAWRVGGRLVREEWAVAFRALSLLKHKVNMGIKSSKTRGNMARCFICGGDSSLIPLPISGKRVYVCTGDLQPLATAVGVASEIYAAVASKAGEKPRAKAGRKVTRRTPEEIKDRMAKAVERRGSVDVAAITAGFGRVTKDVGAEIARELARERGWYFDEETYKLYAKKPQEAKT